VEIDGRPVGALRLFMSRFRAQLVHGRELEVVTGGKVTIDGDQVVLEVTDPDVIEVLLELVYGMEGVTIEVADARPS
jgi:hypothetical protein